MKIKKNSVYLPMIDFKSFITILMVINFVISSAKSGINNSTPFKFFEKARIIENKDSSFMCIYNSSHPGDKYDDIMPMEIANCFLDSLILTDVISAVYFWESHGVNIRKKYYSNDNMKYFWINIDNLPFNDKKELSSGFMSLKRQMITTLYSEFPKELNLTHKGLKFIKRGVDMIDFDYAITRDSLITTVYRCFYKMHGDKAQKTTYGHVNFIRKFDCHDNNWKLVKIDEKSDYFPKIYCHDYIREAIVEDLNRYVTFFYSYRYWEKKRYYEYYGGDKNDDEDISHYNYYNNDLTRFLDEKSPFEHFCEEYYMLSHTFPINILDNIKNPIKILPRDFKHRKDKLAVETFKEPKCVTRLELKIISDSLIIHFYTEWWHYNKKKQSIMSNTAGDLGFFVHKYNCENARWECIDEYFYSDGVTLPDRYTR